MTLGPSGPPIGASKGGSFASRLAAPYRAGVAGIDRRALVLVGVFFFTVAARMSLFTFLGIYFVGERGFLLETVGLAFLVENVVTALVGPFGGALSDRIGRKPVLFGGLVALTLVLPLFLLVDGAIGLIAWSAALGVAQGAYRPAAISTLLDLVPAERRQSALALNYTAISVGYTIGVAPAGFIAAQGYGFLAAASVGGFALAIALAAVGLRGELPREPRAEAPASFFMESLRAPRDPAFLGLAALGLLFPIGIGLVSQALPIYGSETGMTEESIGLVLATSGVLLAALSIPVNARIEGRGPYRFLAAAAVVVAASYVVFALWPGPWGMLVGISVFTVAEVVFATSLPTAVAALAPAGARGAYQGAWGMMFSLGIGSALFLSGVARTAVGWRATWLVFGAATLLAAVGLALSRRRFRRVADERAAAAAPARTEGVDA